MRYRASRHTFWARDILKIEMYPTFYNRAVGIEYFILRFSSCADSCYGEMAQCMLVIQLGCCKYGIFRYAVIYRAVAKLIDAIRTYVLHCVIM